MRTVAKNEAGRLQHRMNDSGGGGDGGGGVAVLLAAAGCWLLAVPIVPIYSVSHPIPSSVRLLDHRPIKRIDVH